MSKPPQILILYAHPTPHHSRVNRRLAQAAAKLQNVKVHDLYELYPDFHIPVRREQALLQEADLIVFQHPVQWYSMPALLKQWVDSVFTPGWAYGPGGDALRGKDFWLVATLGGSERSYQPEGHNQRPFSAFLPPYQQTAELCGMRWLPPHLLFGAHQVNQQALAAYIDTYKKRLSRYPNWPELPAATATTTAPLTGT
ncbi:NAD(P)H-dependent oxidoreductase [Collimonas pratensis]|uniref:Glutathione-regulated potassium-efflux system ancillary protein kefF n=1 Tax=Collimonas pratensis TaxID=279113 RepID=A0A127QRI5_9BURK|nr:NAD(P)H-dependent oxidoreductase [Collimonas pratensis]AMP02859.1 glutathione-regulated potassium-efflux system ancillary protein kefF [Collimonas pratensis]AMP12668.1 glutathione-regulated potassium-efflux system ancillary protein kefF [Collimonas pratensis]NKI71622.1 NAD(P)H dehydrogenase [Collimonas pratensis]